MEYLIAAALAAAVILGMRQYYQREERKLLRRLERMLEEGREGKFCPDRIDESMVSLVEDSMRKFLAESCTAEEKIKEQKDRIQVLISDISHQTVTPVSNILIYSQLLEEEIRGSQCGMYATAIREQTEKLSFLIDSLVKASRLESGIIRLELKEGDVRELIYAAVQQMEAKAEEKEIRICQEITANPILAVFDPKWTEEAVFNILNNAVKYTPNGGMIRIRITPYQMFCRIDVEDSGIGISEEELPKIFGRFYRSPDVAEEEGVGLGLYLAREIIQSGRGYMKVSSEKGQGSVFSIFLPEKVSTL